MCTHGGSDAAMVGEKLTYIGEILLEREDNAEGRVF